MREPVYGKGGVLLTEHIMDELKADHPLQSLARYHLSAGGKCLRGHLVLAQAEDLGLDSKKAMKWAIACELLHNATLIHDDIQDNDPIRRGQASLWKYAGIAEAINVGDFLIFRAFHLTAQLQDYRLSELLSRVSEMLVEGQMDELRTLSPQGHSYWESYTEMARLKTGSLFLLPVEGVQLLAQKEMSAEARKAWLNLGLCYQIYDDVRDFMGLKQEGQRQKDLEEKHINALVALLSTQPEYEPLIASYLQEPATSSQARAIRTQLVQAFKKENIAERLEKVAQKNLKDFRLFATPRSQKIIFDFLDQALKAKGILKHELISKTP